MAEQGRTVVWLARMGKLRMPEGQSEIRTCELRVALFRYVGIKTSYSATSGPTRRMTLQGHIIHEHDPFQDKRACIFLSAPPDLETQEKINTEEQIDSACGIVYVRANVEAKQYHLYGYDDEPIKAVITITPEAFEAIHHQASQAFNHRQIVIADIILESRSFPDIEFVHLQDLDVSVDKSYAVRSFEIFGYGSVIPSARRTLYDLDQLSPQCSVISFSLSVRSPGFSNLSGLLTA